MIGVITKENIHPLLVEIASKKKTNIYWYKNDDIKNGIEKLKEKKCNIIITNQDYSNIEEPNIKFINLNYTPKENDFVIDTDELIDAVNKGNEEKIIELLDNINVPKTKEIIILNPILIFIKHLIQEKFTNKIFSINDNILEEIEKSENEESQIYLIN